jgi:UDP-2-acetamido-3-amino-2,3-dideoxy-glucuronate N-acetyltransferase
MQKFNQTNHKKTIVDTLVGDKVKIFDFVNLYGCEIDDETQIGTFVEIQRTAKIGKRCRIQSHTFICEAVTIEDDVFIGHGVMFINDKRPLSHTARSKTWDISPVLVKRGASIGTGAVIMGGVTIGENSIVGAGAVVTRDVPNNETHIGVPARKLF